MPESVRLSSSEEASRGRPACICISLSSGCHRTWLGQPLLLCWETHLICFSNLHPSKTDGIKPKPPGIHSLQCSCSTNVCVCSLPHQGGPQSMRTSHLTDNMSHGLSTKHSHDSLMTRPPAHNHTSVWQVMHFVGEVGCEGEGTRAEGIFICKNENWGFFCLICVKITSLHSVSWAAPMRARTRIRTKKRNKHRKYKQVFFPCNRPALEQSRSYRWGLDTTMLSVEQVNDSKWLMWVVHAGNAFITVRYHVCACVMPGD